MVEELEMESENNFVEKFKDGTIHLTTIVDGINLIYSIRGEFHLMVITYVDYSVVL